MSKDQFKEYLGIAITGSLVLSGIAGAILFFLVGGYPVSSIILLSIPGVVMLGGLAAT